MRWSIFHFRSAVRQTRLRERVVSSSHGCDMSLGRLSLKGAMESKIAEHEELKILSSSSAQGGGSVVVQMEVATSLARKLSANCSAVRGPM